MEIFGRGSDQVRPITELERKLQRREERIDLGPGPVDDIWSKANICWGALVGAGVDSGYLVGIGVS